MSHRLKFYKKLTVNPDYTISKAKFDEVVQVLRKHKFDELANRYEKAGKEALGKDDNLIHLGAKDKKVKPLVNFALAPFKFAWNIVTLPYRLTQKVLGAMMPKKPKKQELPHIFKLTDPANRVYRCAYCEAKASGRGI